MLGVNVQDGTGAGQRRIKIRPVWPCECTQNAPRIHPGDRYSCPDCGTRRP